MLKGSLQKANCNLYTEILIIIWVLLSWNISVKKKHKISSLLDWALVLWDTFYSLDEHNFLSGSVPFHFKLKLLHYFKCKYNFIQNLVSPLAMSCNNWDECSIAWVHCVSGNISWLVFCSVTLAIEVKKSAQAWEAWECLVELFRTSSD